MLDELIAERLRKLERYKSAGNPYPADVRRDFKINEVVSDFKNLQRGKKKIFITGRLLSIRPQGKIIFADVFDESGKLQIVLKEENVKKFSLINKILDRGDFVEVSGQPFITQKKEKSLLVKNIRLIAKSIRPLPVRWFGVKDTETKLRKRYLDILFNQKSRELFIKKSLFWDTIRDFLKKTGFLEVETPILETEPGGAEAQPFITHHNALNQDFYLRISLELPLKKLLVAGFEKVFEIGRIFRNEGVDREHLQDYTHMECYWAYENYERMMSFTRRLYQAAIKKLFSNLKTVYQGNTINWGGKWPKVDYYNIFKKTSGLDLKTASDRDLLRKAKELKLEAPDYAGRGRLIDLIFKKTARPKLIQPCFLIDPPAVIELLAKRLEKDPEKVARFQIMAAGTELGKGFSELNDPIDQRKRFQEQMILRKKGDLEAQRLAEDFLEAMEYGMPPAAGFGMSERLFAVLMDKPVREAVIFPLMRKED